MRQLDKTKPIIVGLSGKAGSGKTSVAEKIVPKGSVDSSVDQIKWDHIFYALPLYEMASIKKNISGINSESRKLYALHEVLYDLYGGSPLGNMPAYYDLVELVNRIYRLPIEPEGVKPRRFFQIAGDICAEYDANCFASWAISKAAKLYNAYIRDSSSEEDVETPMFGVIISDVRYLKEAQKILEHPNGFVIAFDATQEVLDQRLIKRDGKLMSEEERNHSSEQDIPFIRELSSFVLDTSSMSVEDQAAETVFILNKIKEMINA